jgi:phosphoglycerate dehydrogenase-like enzyme
MRIIIINPQKDFLKDQIKMLRGIGEAVFIEKSPDYKDKIFTDNEEKIIAIGPEVVDWKFSNNSISNIANLKAICLPTTSFSWVDGKFTKDKGIVLTNVPKYSTESVSEYAISLMLNLVRKLPLIVKNEWKLDYNKQQGWDIKGKTMGIIGLGSIGTRIAELGKAMGMNVIYWSKKSKNKKFTYKNLDQVLHESDFIFPCLLRNNETKGILNKQKLSKIKKGSFIVSITGDEIFDLKSALKLVGNGKLNGIAFESEKHNIKNFKGNVLVTPPVAWFTKEAFEEDMKIWVETIISCVKNKPKNVVN